MSTAVKMMRLFPTPIITDRVDEAESLNAALEKAVIARRKADKGVALSNRGGWQSTHDLPAWGGAKARALIDHATRVASAAVTKPAGKFQWHVDAWANVSADGNFNMPHIHGGTFWSGVYYVKTGKSGGNLVLHDPRMPALRMHAPGLAFRDCGPELKAEITPEPGLLVLFPAWLLHSVEPHEGTGERISIAMNIRAVPVWSAPPNEQQGKTR